MSRIRPRDEPDPGAPDIDPRRQQPRPRGAAREHLPHKYPGLPHQPRQTLQKAQTPFPRAQQETRLDYKEDGGGGEAGHGILVFPMINHDHAKCLETHHETSATESGLASARRT